MQSMLPKASGIGARVGGFVAKNPEVVASVLGTGADVYGASLEGAAMDRQFGLQEEALAMRKTEDNRREKLNRLQLLLSQYGRSRARF